MQFDLIADITKLCRVCMTAKEDHLTDLHDASSSDSSQFSLHEMLKAICAPVFEKSEEGHPSGMPTKVCAICRNAILAAFKLHQMCIETDRRLAELLTVKKEPQDLEDDDPLVSNSREVLQDEMLNMNVDDGDLAETKGDMQAPIEQPTEEMVDSFREETIKVEELDLMESSDNDNGTEFDSAEEMEPAVEEDTSKATCKICSKKFTKAASLNLHMTLKHQHLKDLERVSIKTRKLNACNFCAKTFTRNLSLKKHKAALHRNVNDPNKPFTCRLCEYSIATTLELLEHKKTHKNSITCSCGQTFRSGKSLKEHTASGTCLGEKGRRCNICDKIFKSANIMIRHRNSVHTDPVVCPECGQTMANSSSLRIHLQAGYCSQKEGLLAARTCKICGEVQKNHYAVKGHIKQAHPERMLRCEMCSMEFQTKKYLNLHIKTHDTKTFKCKTCSESFFTKKVLIQHQRIHTTPVKCKVCDKLLANKHTLTTHMERHKGFKPYACDICPMRFISKVEIRYHMATHTKNQDHVCDICGSQFTRKNSLQMHVKRAHGGERPYPCSQCSLKFVDANRLQRHMYTHTGEKPKKCELCPQAYAQTNDLVKHVARAHGNGNPYLCDQCDEGFRLLTDLRQHYRVHVQSTEGGADQMEEVRFTSLAILKRAFAKAKQRQSIESCLNK